MIASGGPYAIDAAAHRSSLVTGAAAVSVLASGPGQPYPAGHTDLLANIAAEGLVVSEGPPECRLRPSAEACTYLKPRPVRIPFVGPSESQPGA